MRPLGEAPLRPADNPFASHRLAGLGYRPAGWRWDDMKERLESVRGPAAVVGAKGSGKTALMEELASLLRGRAVRAVISGGSPRPWAELRRQLPHPLTSEHAVFVDGFEQLGPIHRRRLLRAARRGAPIVVTLHRPWALPILVECRTSPGLLRELVYELAPAETARLDPHLDGLFRRHGGNLRECFRELYDLYAGRLDVGFRSQESGVPAHQRISDLKAARPGNPHG